MSHYTVMVIAKDYQELEKKIAPFEEAFEEEHEFTEFIDTTDQVNEFWAERENKFFTDGTLYESKYQKKFMVETEGDIFERKTKYVPPEGWTEVEITAKNAGVSFDEFAQEWEGYTWSEKHESYGRWANPNARWDWWQVGGRWTGALKKVASTEKAIVGIDGHPGIFNERNDDPTRSDSPQR